MDLKKYVTVGDDGKVTFDTDAFNADIDREKTSAINTYSANNSKKLEEEMDLAYTIVKLGRSARNSVNIKNRQPLSKMLISVKRIIILHFLRYDKKL